MRRHNKIKEIMGTPERPRLVIHRSLRHIHAQVIDDTCRKTLLAVSTTQTDLKEQVKGKKNLAASKMVGEFLARVALAKGVKKIVLDRGSRRYHGCLKALADSARAAGLDF